MNSVLETVNKLQLTNSKIIKQIRELQSEITLDIIFYNNTDDNLLNINELLIKLLKLNCENINRLLAYNPFSNAGNI